MKTNSSTTSSEEPATAAGWWVIFIITFATLLASIAALNWVIDPYDALGGISLPGINEHKYSRVTGTAHFLALAFGSYQGLLLGSSRAQNALDPTHPGFGGRRVYNAALAGVSIGKLRTVFEYARSHNDLAQVVVALDFQMFDTGSGAGTPNDASWMPGAREPGFAQVLLTADVTRDSIRTLWGNLQGKPPDTVRGLITETNPVRLFYISEMEKSGYRTGIRNHLRSQLRAGWLKTYAYDPAQVDMLAAIVDESRRDGIDLRLLISPVHALQLEAIYAAGHGKDFARWKRDLVRAAAARDGFPAVPLFDFTGWSGPTAEAVPEDGKRMRWYIEASHYTKDLGDRVLDRVLDHRDPHRASPRDFGVALSSDNIGQHLARMREDRRRYRREFPEDVAAVEALVRSPGRLPPARRR